MALPKPPEKVKLIFSVIYNPKIDFDNILSDMKSIWGEIDFISEEMAFDYTTYYEEEMGKNLIRRFVSFLNLIDRTILPDIKLKSNELELKKYSENKKRLVNFDPGFITLANLVLATCKNWAHRIYLRDGIFADLTLIYKNKEFQALSWTYPDYASEKVKTIFKRIRENYISQLKMEK